MNVISTLAPVAHLFNPAAFLTKLAGHGGGYCLTPDGQLYLGIVHTDASATDHGLALGLIANLTSPDLDAIKQHVATMNAEPAPTWQAIMRRVEAAHRADKAHRAKLDAGLPEDDEYMRLGEEVCEAEDIAMRTPAPHGAALLWKLEKLLGEDDDKNGYSPSWSCDFMAQTLIDMRRILGGDDSALTGAWQEVREVTRALNGSEATLPNEDELQARLTRAERFILDTPATTTAGVLAKLQLAILHGCDDRADNDAMTAGDYDHLQRAASERWDFDRKAAFSALQSLRAMEA